MNKKVMFSVIGLAGLAGLGVAVYAAGAYAFQGNGSQYGPNYTPERHEQMTRAFENNDYNSWKSLMSGRGAANKITEQNFARFAEMHKLRLEGKIEDANKIRAELGLGQGNSQGRGMKGEGRGQNRSGNFVDANGDGKCDRMQ